MIHSLPIMKKNSSSHHRVLTNKVIPAFTIGIDLGDKRHAICMLDHAGDVVEQRMITNHRRAPTLGKNIDLLTTDYTDLHG